MAKVAAPASKSPARTASASVAKKDSARFRPEEVQEIQRLAYQFFVERGYHHGHHEEDWLRAEAIVRSRRS